MKAHPPASWHRAARWTARALLTLVGISVVTFLLLHLLPGDPALVHGGADLQARIPPEAYRLMLHRMGLDRPLGEQYFAWLGALLRRHGHAHGLLLHRGRRRSVFHLFLSPCS